MAVKKNKASRLFIHHYAAKEIKESIVSLHAGNCPVEELIAVGEAVFEFITRSDMDTEMKNAFFPLQRMFDFYKNLVQSKNNRLIMIKQT